MRLFLENLAECVTSSASAQHQVVPDTACGDCGCAWSAIGRHNSNSQ